MLDALRRRWPGKGPWDEVWFLEIDAGDGRTIWLRHTLADGPHRRGLATWAIVTDEVVVGADQSRHPMSGLRTGGTAFDVAETVLDPTNARGQAGAVHWDLQLRDHGRRQALVPAVLDRLGIGRTYVPAGFDLTVAGWIEGPFGRWSLDGARAILGHIWGASNRTRDWAWGHADLDGGQVLFEGLAAHLGPLPGLCTFAVWIGERALPFTSLHQLPTTRSAWGGDRWHLVGRARGVEIEAELTLPAEAQRVRVRYLDPGTGQERTCVNSARSRLDLQVREHGDVRRWQSDLACFELATLGVGAGPMVLSD